MCQQVSLNDSEVILPWQLSQGALTDFFSIYLPASSLFFQPMCFAITSKHRYLSTEYMIGQPMGGAGQGDNRQVRAPWLSLVATAQKIKYKKGETLCVSSDGCLKEIWEYFVQWTRLDTFYTIVP